MKRKSQPDLNQNFTATRTCTECGIRSKEVYTSSKFKKNLCLDCLRDLLLKQYRENK